MKTRSVTLRNVAGGFWGGILGILAFGHFGSLALPFGCFLGVLTGWWYQEIWQSARNSMSRGLGFRREAQTLFARVWEWRPKTALSLVLCQGPTLVQWLRSSKVHCAIARTLAGVAFLAFNFVWMVPLTKWCFVAAATTDFGGLIFLPLFPFGLLWLFIWDLFGNAEAGGSCFDLKFHRDWDEHGSNGAARFFARDLSRLFRRELTTVAVFGGAILLLFGAVSLHFFVVAPLAMLIGVIKGLYQVSRMTGYWLCLTVTMTVTVTTAWITHSHLGNDYVLWLTAIAAGSLSALATEALRSVLASFFAASAHARTCALETCSNQLKPILQTWGLVARKTGGWIGRALS
ncbi:MAG: hypothetical protein WEC84_04470 [Candidatus Andersenbacteria bacterium]